MLLKEYYFILFLPIFILSYRRMTEKVREGFLGVLGFFFALYYGVESVLFLLSVSMLTYALGLGMEKKKKNRGFFLFSSILILIAILIYAKQIRTSFIIGISYYVLMAMGYLLEIYHGKKGFQNPYKLWLGLSFFPLMIQGPITDLHVLYEEIVGKRKKLDEGEKKEGVERILLGYFKKLVIADRLAPFLVVLIENPENTGLGFFLSLCLYSLRLIMDFTGGIDIVIGISLLMGIRLPENFKKPLLAKNLSEFWSRWHITMSNWFRTYVFYPISVGLMQGRWMKSFSKKGKQRVSVYGATLVTWILTGLWHGLNWSFFLWGLSNAVLLILSYEGKNHFGKKKVRTGKTVFKWQSFLRMLRTFLLVSLLRGFDFYENPMVFFGKIGRWNRNLDVFSQAFEKAGYQVFSAFVLIASCSYVIVREYGEKKEEGYEKFVIRIALLGLAILIFGAYGKNFMLSSFIYGSF